MFINRIVPIAVELDWYVVVDDGVAVADGLESESANGADIKVPRTPVADDAVFTVMFWSMSTAKLWRLGIE